MKKLLFPLTFIIISLIYLSCKSQKKPEFEPRMTSKRAFNLHLIHANEFIKLNDYDKAIQEANAALKINPKAAEGYNLLGIAFFFKKVYKFAEENFLKSLNLRPSYAQAYNNLGNTSYLKGEIEQAK